MRTSAAVHRRRGPPRGRRRCGPPDGAVEHEVTGDRDPEPVRVQRRRRAGARPGRFRRRQAGRLEDGGARRAVRCRPRPRSGPSSGPCRGAAALTRLLEITARATARASASSVAPVTWQVMSDVAPSPSAACWRARSRATASTARASASRGRGPGADRIRARGAGGEHEHRVVGARVAVDRQLVPGPGCRRPEDRPPAAPGDAAASVRTTDSIVAMLGWIIPTPLAIPVTRTSDVPPPACGQDHGHGRRLGRRVRRPQGRRRRPSSAVVGRREGRGQRRRRPLGPCRAAAACR